MEQTGGFFYHYLAARNSLRYWRNYRRQIKDFLSLALAADHKLLVGPSAGYCFSQEHKPLLGAQDCYLDVDPLARPLFQMRWGKKARWIGEDFLCIHSDPVFSAHQAVQKLMSLQASRILFCNLLGQLAYRYPNQTSEYWQQYIHTVFTQCPVTTFSFHDRWTLLAPRRTLDQIERNWPHDTLILADNELKTHLQAIEVAQPCQVLAHPTEALSPEQWQLDRQVLWRRHRGCLHIIDCVSSTNQ